MVFLHGKISLNSQAEKNLTIVPIPLWDQAGRNVLKSRTEEQRAESEGRMKKYTTLLVVFVAVTGLLLASNADAQKRRMQTYKMDLEDKMASMMKEGWKCVVSMGDSNSGKGQDVELRLTMPLEEFKEFAPIAALEAAAIPHKFDVVYIILRHVETRRIGRVAFRDADPIAARYLAGDKRAVREMNDAIIWH